MRSDRANLAYAKENQGIEELTLESRIFLQTCKSSHSKWIHPKLPKAIIIAGKDGDDAKAYLEKQVNESLEQLKAMEEEETDE